MSKPSIKPAAALVGLLALAVTALLASAGGAQGPGERTFKVIEKADNVALVDLPPKSRDRRNPRISPGDLDVFTTKLFDQSGRRVGRTDAHCIAVRAGRSFDRARFHCNGTATLRDGTIAVSVAFGDGQTEEDVRWRSPAEPAHTKELAAASRHATSRAAGWRTHSTCSRRNEDTGGGAATRGGDRAAPAPARASAQARAARHAVSDSTRRVASGQNCDY